MSLGGPGVAGSVEPGNQGRVGVKDLESLERGAWVSLSVKRSWPGEV